MEFRRYLARIERLYHEGVISNFHPDLLRRFGGTLALAGIDARTVRVEEDAYLGFIDAERAPQELWDTARASWQVHRTAIVNLVSRGRNQRFISGVTYSADHE